MPMKTSAKARVLTAIRSATTTTSVRFKRAHDNRAARPARGRVAWRHRGRVANGYAAVPLCNYAAMPLCRRDAMRLRRWGRDPIAEDRMRPDPLLVQLVEHHRLEDREAVAHRAPESDLRRL